MGGTAGEDCAWIDNIRIEDDLIDITCDSEAALIAVGSGEIPGALVEGDADIDGDLTVSGSTIINGMTEINANADISGELRVEYIDSVLTIGGAAGYSSHTGLLTSNEEHIIMAGNTSDYIMSVQDGSGRVQHYWNSTTDSPDNLYLVDDERAWMWDLTIANDPYMEFKYAPSGLSGDVITWTTHMAFDTLGNVDVLGDVTASGFVGDGSGLTGVTTSDDDWTVSGSNMYTEVAGNVGIGTTSPEAELDVTGGIKANSLKLTDGASEGYMLVSDVDGDAIWTDPSLLWSNGWTVSGADLYKTEVGNVGIGTTTPTDLLHIAGADGNGLTITSVSSSPPPVITLDNSDNNHPTLITNRDGNLLNLEYDGDKLFNIDTLGFVGIGTDNPQDPLHIEAYDSTDEVDDGVFVSVRNTCNDTLAYSGIRFKNHSNGGDNFYKGGILWQRKDSWGRGDMIFAVRNTTDNGNISPNFARMTIKGNGDIGIGTSEPTAKLDVAGSGNFSGTVSGADAVNDDDFVTKGQLRYEVGDFAHGGIVFWVDETGQHGLVCAKEDQDDGRGIQWYNGVNEDTEAHGNGVYAGEMNTMLIIARQGSNSFDYAAGICANYSVTEDGVEYGDWYLPTWKELSLMFAQRTMIELTATSNGGTAFADTFYWSSNESDASSARVYNFSSGYITNNAKDISTNRVRAVRRF